MSANSAIFHTLEIKLEPLLFDCISLTVLKNHLTPNPKKDFTKISSVLTLFLSAMGGISPYMSVTWYLPVGIGLKRPMTWQSNFENSKRFFYLSSLRFLQPCYINIWRLEFLGNFSIFTMVERSTIWKVVEVNKGVSFRSTKSRV